MAEVAKEKNFNLFFSRHEFYNKRSKSLKKAWIFDNNGNLSYADSDLLGVKKFPSKNAILYLKLSEETQNKDAVLMEQVLVIRDLASQVKNVVFTNTVESVSLTVAQTQPASPRDTFKNYVETLSEENKLLMEEIEKKDAILMEQLLVIDDLASKLKNTVSEPILSNFSLV